MLPSATPFSIRLLIVERNPATRDALISLLKPVPGIEFIGAVPPESAVRQAVLRRVNVVLLDVLKPHASSARLCQELCALTPRPAVMAMTTFANLNEERDLRCSGAVGYWLKEVHLEKLVYAIRHIWTQNVSLPAQSTNPESPCI